ncbi:class I lanthipeptide [Chitinophaga nivalis]|uniref:Class I lanthipeptide n=1 Tax=Chitinophaga nivalis TaxID=2991709 RepID=A0ABT3IN34_9BACT|nr:class I lanthipeptide [Chitinophaga nivalis]MCW3464920.1 class I lanthipeptide [Chitinophaga nivalis]MCW3485388.1 class I lanthipeptide [Chitinophaga nivalis]
MKKKIAKKLSLKKINIAALTPASQQHVNGGIDLGITVYVKSCIVYCDTDIETRMIKCFVTVDPRCALSRVLNNC